jgi:hypothetical protein
MAVPNPFDPTKLSNPTDFSWIGSQQTVDDSMAGQVAKLASKDSALNRMAATEGLKAANRRGLLNSSMAVGAAQDAVLQNVMPIASQDAAQAYGKNQAARAFEYGMTAQEQGQRFQTGERLGAQEFQTGENVAARGWQTAENIAQRGFLGTQAELDRDLEKSLQANQISAADQMQVRQIASTEGIEAANRTLQQVLQQNDITFRMKEGNLDRAAALQAQQNDIAFQTSQNALTRSLQDRIAKLNLSGTQQAGAAQMVSNAQAGYQTEYQSIMSNTNLSAGTRSQLLKAANNRYRSGLNLVEQVYNINLGY